MTLSEMAAPTGVDFSFLDEYAKEVNKMHGGVSNGEPVYIVALAKYIYELECRICDLEAKLEER